MLQKEVERDLDASIFYGCDESLDETWRSLLRQEDVFSSRRSSMAVATSCRCDALFSPQNPINSRPRPWWRGSPARGMALLELWHRIRGSHRRVRTHVTCYPGSSSAGSAGVNLSYLWQKSRGVQPEGSRCQWFLYRENDVLGFCWRLQTKQSIRKHAKKPGRHWCSSPFDGSLIENCF